MRDKHNALDLGGILLPIETQTQTTAILGIRDSGKTNTAAAIAEELLQRHQQIVVLDPTDAWWGLKTSADGERDGFPVIIIGGRHADLPLDSGDGKTLADFVVESGASVVISMRGFESQGEEKRFTTAFLRRLYFLKGQQDNPSPLTIFIDEASRLVPQRVMGEDAQCVGAVQQIVRQGRSSGFGIALIDQRASSVNKDVLDMLEMLVVHRATGPRDRKALKDWIEAHDTEGREKEFLASLASLQRGEAWFWSPLLDLFQRTQVRKRKTYDSSKTPKAGDRAVPIKKVAKVDLEALKVKLSATIEKARADDPVKLRAEIAALKREAAKGGGEDLVASAREGLDLGRRQGASVERQRVQRSLGSLIKLGDLIQRAVANLSSQADEMAQGLDTLLTEMKQREEAAPPIKGPAAAPFVAGPPLVKGRDYDAPAGQTIRRSPPPILSVSGGLSGVEQRILNGLAFLAGIGFDQPSRAMLAAYVGYHPRTPAFTNPLGSLRTKGMLDYGEGVFATEKGRKLWKNPEPCSTLSDVHAAWMDKCSNVEAKILRALLENGQSGMTRIELAERCNYHPRTPAFTNPLGKLHTMGLVKNARPNEVPTSALFPEGFR